MKTRIILTVVLATIITFSFGKIKNDLRKPMTGSWGTCVTSNDCPCPPIGCFKGGDQCVVRSCKCPCSGRISGKNISDIKNDELLEIATQFAIDAQKDGTIQTEYEKQILIDFVINTIKNNK